MSVVVEPVAIRSGTTADWAASDAPTLGLGEMGLDTTTGQYKFGDGATLWASLPSSGGAVKAQGKATLTAGTVTVANAKATTTAIILLTVQVLGTVTAPKPIAVTARSNGVSFTITSSDNTDTSVVGWQIIEP